MVEEYGLYLGSCRMNSEGVYERWGGSILTEKKKNHWETGPPPTPWSASQAGHFPSEKGYFISNASGIHSSSFHNG